MGTMMALRAHVRGGPGQLVYEQAPAPAAGPGEALVAVHAAAITFAELTWDLSWTTRDGADRTPVIPSHELSGVIAGLGPGVTNLAVGDAVIGLIDFDRDGAAAEYVAVRATHPGQAQRRCPHQQAATLPLAAILGGHVTATGRGPTLTSCAAWARNASSVSTARMPPSARRARRGHRHRWRRGPGRLVRPAARGRPAGDPQRATGPGRPRSTRSTPRPSSWPRTRRADQAGRAGRRGPAAHGAQPDLPARRRTARLRKRRALRRPPGKTVLHRPAVTASLGASGAGRHGEAVVLRPQTP